MTRRTLRAPEVAPQTALGGAGEPALYARRKRGALVLRADRLGAREPITHAEIAEQGQAIPFARLEGRSDECSSVSRTSTRVLGSGSLVERQRGGRATPGGKRAIRLNSMPHLDDRPPPRRTARDTLLSAALSGLIWLSASCGSSGNGAPRDAGRDGGPAVDAGRAQDAGRARDAGAASDAGAARDAGSMDAGSMDAGSMDAGSMDAGAMDAGSMDAGSMDAGTPTDAGPAPVDAFCDVLPPAERRVTSTSDAGLGMTQEEFTAMCEGLGGYIEVHPECGGHNTCRGISYRSDTGVLTEHTCALLNTCAGYSCILPSWTPRSD